LTLDGPRNVRGRKPLDPLEVAVEETGVAQVVIEALEEPGST
jgi:hypothetical protein